MDKQNGIPGQLIWIKSISMNCFRTIYFKIIILPKIKKYLEALANNWPCSLQLILVGQNNGRCKFVKIIDINKKQSWSLWSSEKELVECKDNVMLG